MESTPGSDADVLADYKAQCNRSPHGFILHPEEERSPEYVHIYFMGTYEGREVVYDAVLYTLRLEFESEMQRIVEEMTREKFPDYSSAADDNDEPTEDTEPPEEVAMFMAEAILSLEEDESVRVKEQVEVGPVAGHQVGLDVSLNVEDITDETIARFIRDFNAGHLKLDPTLYTFQFNDTDEE